MLTDVVGSTESSTCERTFRSRRMGGLFLSFRTSARIPLDKIDWADAKFPGTKMMPPPQVMRFDSLLAMRMSCSAALGTAMS